jgi:hypothetical protein
MTEYEQPSFSPVIQATAPGFCDPDHPTQLRHFDESLDSESWQTGYGIRKDFSGGI